LLFILKRIFAFYRAAIEQMNYRHIHHAGNFADVFKHWILTLLLQHFHQKDKPFAVLDTHAGIGFYDLHSALAEKTNEASDGIFKLLTQTDVPESMHAYIDIVKMLNTTNKLSRYPGSPAIIQHYLREQDDCHVCELHDDDFQTLKSNFFHDKRIHMHHTDAYQAINALLPFKQKRGLILIDPPFEQKNEFAALSKSLQNALHKFRQGIYAIWYPIKDYEIVQAFYQTLNSLDHDELFIAELIIDNLSNPLRLNGCGMAIINPPWQLACEVNDGLPYLRDLFCRTSGKT